MESENISECGCVPMEELNCDCSVCGTKDYLTAEEEFILGKLRSLKLQVRPITEKMKEITPNAGLNGISYSDISPEWAKLSDQLLELRSQWHHWENRLDEAIESKLIALGHREPRT